MPEIQPAVGKQKRVFNWALWPGSSCIINNNPIRQEFWLNESRLNQPLNVWPASSRWTKPPPHFSFGPWVHLLMSIFWVAELLMEHWRVRLLSSNINNLFQEVWTPSLRASSFVRRQNVPQTENTTWRNKTCVSWIKIILLFLSVDPITTAEQLKGLMRGLVRLSQVSLRELSVSPQLSSVLIFRMLKRDSVPTNHCYFHFNGTVSFLTCTVSTVLLK